MFCLTHTKASYLYFEANVWHEATLLNNIIWSQGMGKKLPLHAEIQQLFC